MHSLFSQEKPSFSQAVLVPFPKKGTYAVGFLVGDKLPEGSELDDNAVMSILFRALRTP